MKWIFSSGDNLFLYIKCSLSSRQFYYFFCLPNREHIRESMGFLFRLFYRSFVWPVVRAVRISMNSMVSRDGRVALDRMKPISM